MTIRPTRPRRAIVAAAMALLAGSAPDRQGAAGPLLSPVALPATACVNLAGTDLAAIGAVDSRATSALKSTTGGVTVCAVEGVLVPAIGFRVDLPTGT